jgi:amino acid transporter
MSEPIRLSVDIKLREKSVIALIILLLLPNTFYWAGFTYGSGNFTGAFDNVISYLTQSTELIYAGLSYLTLFAAFILRNRPQVRSLMIVLGSVFQLMSLIQFIIRMLVNVEFKFLAALKAVFIYSDNYFPFQLFTTLALVPLIYLLRQNMPWLRSEIGKFTTNFKNSGRSFKTICAYLAAILLGIFVVFGLYTNIKALIDFNGNFYPRGFYPEIPLALVAYILDVLLTTVFLGIVLVYIFNHFDLISNAVKELNSVLRDFRLSTYVTRQISGFLYWLYYVVVVGVFALIAPFQTFIEFEQTRQGLDSGFQPQLLLILVGGPLLTLVMGYFVILILRLVFELLIALVHIAQNTASARR